MPDLIIGLDIGLRQGYTAIVIIEAHGRNPGEVRYDVRYIERFKDLPGYDKVVDIVRATVEAVTEGQNANSRARSTSEVYTVVDATGAGLPIVDYLRRADLDPIPVVIHGGDRTRYEDGIHRVPKRDLCAILQVLLQDQRLRIAAGLEMASILRDELLNFQVKIDPRMAHDSYSAWREKDHDDLVLATGLACWYGENRPEPWEFW